jgi:hypothetical protein
MHVKIIVLEENVAFIFGVDPEGGSAFCQNTKIWYKNSMV